jgi:hypothetical protein
MWTFLTHLEGVFLTRVVEEARLWADDGFVCVEDLAVASESEIGEIVGRM